MLYTLTANPSVDVFLEVPRLLEEDISRVTAARRDAGGKGINVARVFRVLGGRARAVCLLGGRHGQWLAGRLEEENIPLLPIPADGESRTIYNILEKETGRLFRINETGPPASEKTLAGIHATLASLPAGKGDFFAVSGSTPPGVPDGFYARLVRLLKEKGFTVALDCDGPPMLEALAAGPDIIKPNLFELGRLAGRETGDAAAGLSAAREIIGRGKVGTVVVSLGPEGALAVTRERAFHARPPAVEARSTVGAGDALLAGFLYELSRGKDLPAALLAGIAAGSASVTRPGTAGPERREISAIREKVSLEEI